MFDDAVRAARPSAPPPLRGRSRGGGGPLRPVLTSHACVVRTQIVIMNAHRLSKMQVREAKAISRGGSHESSDGGGQRLKEAAPNATISAATLSS